MDEKKLWKYIRKNSKPSFEAPYNDDDKLLDVVANRGLDPGQIAVRGSGEYDGFSIRAITTIKPVLTDNRVSRAVKYLSEGNIQEAVAVLRIVEETREQGLGFLYSVLKIWLEKNDIQVPSEYVKKATPIKSKQTVRWITAGTFYPIQDQFEIYDTGVTKAGTPVVPESWIGRVFKNADELHEEMDKLDWRRGKPPVNFCCIYAMFVEKQTRTWKPISEDTYNINVRVAISMFPTFHSANKQLKDLHSEVQFFNKKTEYHSWLKNIPKDTLVLSADLNTDHAGKKLLIACPIYSIIEKEPEYIKTKTTGLLVSTMQKMFQNITGYTNQVMEVTSI